jgi:hypothetical protein
MRSAPEVTQLSSVVGTLIKTFHCICCPSTCQAGTENRTGVALPILNLSSRREWGGQCRVPDSLRPGKRPGTLVLEGGWKISLVTLPTETSRPPTTSYRRPVPVVRGVQRKSTAAILLGLWVWIPPGVWMSVACECCVLSGRGLCDGLITRPEESWV